MFTSLKNKLSVTFLVTWPVIYFWQEYEHLNYCFKQECQRVQPSNILALRHSHFRNAYFLSENTSKRLYHIFFKGGAKNSPWRKPPGNSPQSNFPLVSSLLSVPWVRNTPGVINRGALNWGEFDWGELARGIFQGGEFSQNLLKDKNLII